jgi:hypothetical protein
MLVNVSTALELFGNIYAEAESASARSSWEAWVECDLWGEVALSTSFEGPFEFRTYNFGDVVSELRPLHADISAVADDLHALHPRRFGQLGSGI